MSKDSYQLSEVFGTWQESISPTYVDRANLDQRFTYLLGTPKLIVIHGGAKQGKTILRKRNLSDDKALVVNCYYGATTIDILIEILREAGISTAVTQIERSKSKSQESSTSGGGGVNAGVAKLDSQIGRSSSQDDSATRIEQTIGGDPTTLGFALREIKNALGKSGIRIVLDDFHFLTTEVQIELAHHLKKLQEDYVYAVVVGVWPQRQLLTTYNQQLRAEDIDIRWTDKELGEIIDLGSHALNIVITNNIRNAMIADAYDSVGLLQILAEKLCEEMSVYGTLPNPIKIESQQVLDSARQKVCEDQLSRYRNFFELMVQGYREREDSLYLYERILRVCVEDATDQQLLDGLRSRDLLSWIQRIEPRTTQGPVTQALQRLNGLQDKRAIPYPVFYYDGDKLQLVDRELLFYRKYRKSPYPWETD